jgi:cell wall-associated NlpC family hydrolase
MKTYPQVFFIIAAIIILSGFMSFEAPDPGVLLKNTPQDVLRYTSDSSLDLPLVSSERQQKFYQNYLNIYFSPWKQAGLLYANKNLQKVEEDFVRKFKLDPGYGENKRRHTDAWVNQIAENMGLSTYPNTKKPAITIRVTHLRALPSNEPIFKNWDQAGEGYPFDGLAVSLLPANLPIQVMHISNDHAWALVLTSYNAIGWMPVNDYALVDKNFMVHWQTKHYAAIVKDKMSLLNGNQRFLFFTRIGAIYPIAEETPESYRILVAVAKEDQQASIQTALLSKQVAVTLPLTLTKRNIGKIANAMLGQPYDWGGAYDARDCSATLMDLFASFGIWLPRNSGDQMHVGTFISLANIDDPSIKKAFIEQHAIPFLTILWMPGHVVLYLGKQGSRDYIYQTMWGLHTWSWFKGEDRLIVGRTVITPIDFGEDFSINIPSFLNRARGMVLLTS